jgi:hypothetical protein
VRVLLLGLGLMLCLNGCALPPALTIASFAADGVSYLATGKSTTDHALSAIAQEDCAMMRAIAEKPICAPAHKEAASQKPKGKHPPRTNAAAPSPAVKAPTIAPTVWDFPLIKKETVSRPEPPDVPRLVAKDTPARPVAKPNVPVYLAKTPHRPAVRQAPPPLASGPIIGGACAETPVMRPAAQCDLGPGA